MRQMWRADSGYVEWREAGTVERRMSTPIDRDVEFSNTLGLRMASIFEHFLKAKVWVQARDGIYYRPKAGWPLPSKYETVIETKAP